MSSQSAISSLVSIKDGKAFTTSLIVAKVFGRQHKHVLDSIDVLIASEPYQERPKPNFRLRSRLVDIPTSGQREERLYEMDRQGFEVLAMGFTGDEALRWKFKYSDAFAALERAQRDQNLLGEGTLITTERLPKLPKEAPLSLETRQSLESICQTLKIIAADEHTTAPLEELMAKPGWVDSLEVVPLLAAVLDDIWNWRYPYPYAYGRFGYVGRGVIYLNLDHVFDHLRNALHFKDSFAYMKSGAKWRIEQALMQGALPKIKKGPVVNDVRLNYRVDIEELLDTMTRIRERQPCA
ncbi:MAG: Rha family transcriptional regulator [Candidatus Competibacter denitrificans]